MNTIRPLSGFGAAIALSLWSTLPGVAQITPDTTLPINSQVVPGCTVCVITGGTERGVNLYHSFREFSVPTGGEAWFNNSLQIQNILTRVTGTSPSNIDGLMRTNGSANLFFLNPNGIIFGSNAHLQIGGSFFATTANSFQFFDGTEFSAVNPQAPPLLTVNITPGLQYGTGVGNLQQAGQLSVPSGQSLTLQGNTVMTTGTLTAPGGTVQVLGDRVALLGNAAIDVSSPNSGGTIRVGGDLQGRGAIPTATATYIAPTATLRADAGEQGNGGQIIAWGNQSLKAYGTFTARGGSQGGDGGLVETSSPAFLDVLGIQVDAAAVRGTAGTWLIDPYDVTIQNIAPTNGTFNNAPPDFLFTPTGNNAVINPGEIEGRLFNGTNVTITTGTSGNQAGNITIADPISKNPFSGPATLTLEAANDIIFLPGAGIFAPFLPFVASPLNVNLIAGRNSAGSGGVVINGSILTNGGDVTIVGRSLTMTGGSITTSLPSSRDPGVPGGAGAITINANLVSLDNSRLESETRSGDGKPITINADQVSLNGSFISTRTFTFPNNAADIRLNVTGSLTLNTGSSISSVSNAFSGAQVTGAGFVSLNANTISMNQSIVSSNGNASNGGGIAINATAGSVNLIDSNINSLGRGGDGAPTTITATDRIQLTNSGLISRGLRNNAGPITLTAPQIAIENTSILAQSYEVGTGGTIAIRASDSLVVTDRSVISNETFGGGNSGDLIAQAGSNLLINSSELSTSTYVEGNGGPLTLRSPSINLVNQARVLSVVRRGASGNGGQIIVDGQVVSLSGQSVLSANTFGSGNAGSIQVQNADTITLANGTISSAVSAAATGNGGGIVVQTRSLNLTNGANVTTSTQGVGNAGEIQITASGDVTLSDRQTSIFVSTTPDPTVAFAQANAGRVAIRANSLTVANGAQIAASTTGAGRAGDVQVNVNSFEANQGGQLLTSTTGSGSAGNINLTIGDRLFLSDAGTGLFASTTSFANAGRIAIQANSVEISQGAQIAATTTDAGRAGDIQVDGNTFDANRGGQLLTSTSGSGSAGNINLNIRDRLFLSDSGTGLFASTALGSTGAGGNIIIDPQSVVVQNGAQIAVDSQGRGIGGSISLQAGRLELRDRGSITAETASAQGGNISLDVRNLLLLRRNSLISATAGTAQAAGNGGNVNIRAEFIVGALGENSDIVANAFTGKGGNITITTNAIFGLLPQARLTPLSDITASSEFGLSGTIAINTLNVDPSRGLAALKADFTDQSQQIGLGCAVGGRLANRESRFIVSGRGGVIANPTGPFTGEQPLGQLLEGTTDQSAAAAQAAQPTITPVTPAPIIEAQGWQQSSDGSIYLFAQAATAQPPARLTSPLQCDGTQLR